MLIHGLGGGPYELEPLAAAIRRSGIETQLVTLPGHSEAGPRMPASRWEDWYGEVESQFDRLNEHQAVSALGFSTGGTLALRLAQERRVERLILLAPFLAIPYARLLPMVDPSTVVRWLCRFRPNLTRKPAPIRDPASRREFAIHERYTTFSAPAVLSALDLIGRVTPRLSEIETPTLILQGKRDRVVDLWGARTVNRYLGSTHKQLVWLERSDHIVAWDFDRQQVEDQVLAFLGQPAAEHA